LAYLSFAFLYIAVAVIAAVTNILSMRATGDMAQSAEMGDTAGMMRFLYILVAVSLVTILAEALVVLLRQRFQGKTIHIMRRDFARLLLSMPYKKYSLKNSGEGVSLFTNDIPNSANFTTLQILSQISQLLTLVATIVFMVFINWWLTLIYFALFPALAVLQAKISAPIGRKSIIVSEKRAAFNAVVADALQNPLTLKAYGLEASAERRFDKSYMEAFHAQFDAVKTQAVLAFTGIIATILPAFALFLAAGAVVLHGDMSIAEFISYTLISLSAASWLMMFAQELSFMQHNAASSKRMLDYDTISMDTPPEKPEPAAQADSSPAPAIQFKSVAFGYTEESNAIHNLSFTVEKGTITAISGPSGCGKSTVLKLMLGLYQADEGQISLSSTNLTYVPQDCHLLPISIKDNIICGLEYDESKLRAACENAGILKFIQGLPEGFNAVLNESAANISGGQKQRIAMARAFYRDADILLLDEATSALDAATEAEVLAAFTGYVKTNRKTAVVVAHRQSLLDISDRVITLGGQNSLDSAEKTDVLPIRAEDERQVSGHE
jgi:ABC-type bacteriocin/lantibiotic exporter with double-glycine peptidase domain